MCVKATQAQDDTQQPLVLNAVLDCLRLKKCNIYSILTKASDKLSCLLTQC